MKTRRSHSAPSLSGNHHSEGEPDFVQIVVVKGDEQAVDNDNIHQGAVWHCVYD